MAPSPEISMYDHLGLKVKNLDASVRFYTEVLAPLGYVLCSRDDSGAGFGPKDAPALWLYLHKGATGLGTHIAFRAPDHAAIKKFHAAGLKLSLIHISEPTRQAEISYAVFCLKKKKK